MLVKLPHAIGTVDRPPASPPWIGSPNSAVLISFVRGVGLLRAVLSSDMTGRSEFVKQFVGVFRVAGVWRHRSRGSLGWLEVPSTYPACKRGTDDGVTTSPYLGSSP